MGFKQVDLVPFYVSPSNPASKSSENLLIQVSRTDTVASVKSILPADASILGLSVFGSVASDAATTATITFTVANNSGTISTGSYDVKTNGAVTGGVSNLTNMPNLEPLPLNGDLRISAVYAETGTASTTGGPWRVRVFFTR